MDFKKLLSASNIIACLAAVVSIISLILYGANFGGAGFYHGVAIPLYVMFGIFAIVAALAVIGLSLVPAKGMLGKVLDVVVMVLKVLIPVFLFIMTFNAISSRVEGFGYIYFANVDVKLEVQTPENLASAGLAITNIIFTAIAALIGLVGAFFLPKKEEE